MSHELRTPLNAILGMSESLQSGVFGLLEDRQHKSIVTIEKSGKHLLALINDILDLAKIEANKFNLELTDISVRSLCHNSTLFIKELALKKQIRLTTQIPSDLEHQQIRVDDLRFRQVLINLLSNAVKFTPEDGSITLDVRLVEGSIHGDIQSEDPQPHPLHIAFSIIDTGIGIAPENFDRLFQSFVQIDSSLNRKYAGTGLGLSLAKRIIEMHGGTISVQSEVNRGSCFTALIPFISTTETIVSPSILPSLDAFDTETATTSIVKQKVSILMVEDNEASLETTTGYLKSRGYETIEAIDGLQAIDLLQTNIPDIILMDIQMPRMNGFEAIECIRQIPNCATIPIVALTALAMPSDRQKCLDAGANIYLTKPVVLSQLVATIESLLNANQNLAN